jgi:PAS domain S-box-containing protein
MNSDDRSSLAERVKKLGREKSHLQLIFTMITRVVSVSGLDNVCENLLQCVVDCIGGTNLILYFRVDDDLYSVDIYGVRRHLDRIDDELVSRVFESRQPHEREHDFRDTRMTTPEFTKAYTWTYPLLVGAEIIGVFKVEGLHIGMRELYRQLPTFFAYVAMVLKNEIRSETRLQKALDEVTREVEQRRRIEEDLRRAREMLEERVLERTGELRSSEEKYRRIVETANEGILAMDGEHRTTFVNEKMAEMLGYRSAEMLGQPVEHFIFPEEMDDHLFRMEVRQMGGSESYERRFRRKDGGECWCSVSATALHDEQGASAGSFAMLTDITERKRAEASLRKSEALLSVTQGMTKVGGWEWDVVKRTMTWTDEVYRIHEFSRPDYHEADETLIGRSLACYAPEDRDAVDAAFRRCVTWGEPYDMECSFTTAKGRRLWVRTRAHAEWQWGKVVRVIGNIMDITDRKRTEEELRESEERFRGAFQYSAIGMAIVSPKGAWVKVNRSICSIVGYTEDELSTMTFQDITHPDDLDSDLKYVRQMLAGEIEAYTMEKRYFHKNGGIVWVLMSVALVRDGAGAPLYFISQIQNITDSKQAETSLKASLAEKEVLLREVHHRVKNNLAAIIALLEMQQKGIADPKAAASLRELAVRIKSMALVHEKLYRSDNLARIDFQDYLEPLTSNLRTTFGVSDSVRCDIDAAGIEFGLDQAIPCALIINELVTNAMKHAFPMGKPVAGFATCDIRITVKMDGDECTLSVADNGIGLPPDLDWRSCSSLGLRLVRMLGEHQLGGHILLDPTEGTRFILRFTSRRGR